MTKPPDITPEGVAPIAQSIEIRIIFNPSSGELRVSAPPDNILAQGMLSQASEILHSRGRANISQSGLVRPV